MKQAIGIITRTLFGRVARNIYFWLLMLRTLWYNDTATYKYPPAVYHKVIPLTLVVMIAHTCVNNFWLLPRYLSKRKYGQYLTGLLTCATIGSILLVIIVKTLRQRYPEIAIHHISLISSPIDASWAAKDFITDTLWMVPGILIWTLLMTMAWYANEYFRKEKEAALYKQQETATQLSFLKSQINPHFLFNTLNNLYGLALKKSDDTPEAIMKLSSIMRYMLDESTRPLVSSAQEQEIMKAYIDLELLRITDREQLHFSITTDRDYQLPGLLWLPILENVFKHGTRIISEQLSIDFRFAIEDHKLTIKSRNFYKPETSVDKHAGHSTSGTSVEKNESHSGIGLSNLIKRLDMLYPSRYHLNISADNNHYNLELLIHLTRA